MPHRDEDQARSSFETRSSRIDVASPWSNAAARDGSVQRQPDLQAGREQTSAARIHGPGLTVIPTAVDTTAGLWGSATASTVINDLDPRRVHLQSIMSLIGSHGFDGIQIDDEDFPADNRDRFSGFVTDLGQAVLRDTDPGGPDPFGGRPFRYDRVGTTAATLTRRRVVALAGQNRVDETWDVGAQSPHLAYTADGVQHENGRSAAAKFDLAGQYRLGGVERWRLGGEDPAGWEPGP